jgi:hypothetical protein
MIRPSLPSRLALLGLLSLLSACGGTAPIPESKFVRDNRNLERTISVIQNSPADNAINVAIDSEVRIKFSGRLSWGSVDNFKFRVEDEFGILVPGEIRTNNAYDEIVFIPTIRGREGLLSPNTTYTVRSRFLEDQNGYLIGPYNFQFRTQGASTTTGEFKVLSVLPEDDLLLPGQKLSIRFNEEVAPPEPDEQIPGEPQCSATLWNDAFQVFVVVPLDQEGNMEVRTLRAGKICRKLQTGSDRYDTLLFYPANGNSVLPGASYVDIVIRPTESLRGNSSGQRLEREVQKRKFVLPDPLLILNLLF